MKISLVAAVAENNVIGADGDMPWRLSTDLKRFKALTLGKPMIMGRKTFESIGKALPGRTSIVVTRDVDWQAQGVVPVQTMEDAFALAEQIAQAVGQEEFCVVGGGEIYKQAMDQATTLHITRVHASPQGDTIFPQINDNEWVEISRETIPSGDKDTADTTYIVYERHG